MVTTTNRLVELNLTSDPDATLSGQTWSFFGGELLSAIDATLDADITGTSDVMQTGDLLDLDGDGIFEATYDTRFNYTNSTYTLGDNSTLSSPINIIKVFTGGVAGYYMIVGNGIAPSLDSHDLASITFGNGFAPSANMLGSNFDNANDYQLVCFGEATHIDTPKGQKPVEQLSVGDMVHTKDNGLQMIRWIGSRKVQARGAFAPVVFFPGAIGNSGFLRLSQQHRVQISGGMVDLYFGEASVLAPAHALVNGHNIVIQEGGEQTYFHLLFDDHQLLRTQGVWTESFFPDVTALSTQPEPIQREIYAIFPELAHPTTNSIKTARMCIKPWEARVLSKSLQLSV